MIFQLLGRPSTKWEVCCAFPLYPITTIFNCFTSLPSLAMSFCNKSSRRHQTQLCATSDAQGVATKAQGIRSCTASFWTGGTGTRAALQDCPRTIMHLPEWKVPAKWTAMLPLNIGTKFPKIPAQTQGSWCNCVFRRRIIPQFFRRNHHSSFGHLSMCEPYNNILLCIFVCCMFFFKLIICSNIGMF